MRLWYNNRRAVIIPSYGQGDTRARPASAMMANYTMPLRGNRLLVGNDTMLLRTHGIICAAPTVLPFVAAGWRRPLQNSRLRMLHHSQNRLCRFHCRFAAGKPEWACCCGIITAERLLYQSYGQGDTRARPAPAMMADYTMPLRGHGIITAERLLYRHMAKAIRGRGPLLP